MSSLLGGCSLEALLTCPADKAGFHRVVVTHSLASLPLAVS
jgi:hypothetical protein